MALIYGRAESEKELLDLYPKKVKKIEDIDRVHQELKDELKGDHKGFFGSVKKWNKQRQFFVENGLHLFLLNLMIRCAGTKNYLIIKIQLKFSL